LSDELTACPLLEATRALAFWLGRFFWVRPTLPDSARTWFDPAMSDVPAYLKMVDTGPPLHAVMQAIAEGEHWLLAWNRQSTTIYRLLGKESSISNDRLREIEAGADVTIEEVVALARTWRVDPAAVVVTLPTKPIGDLADRIEAGEWVLELDGELDAALHLTFRDGGVFENGMSVGRYAETLEGVRATIGEDVVLLIGALAGDAMPVTMVTERHGDGADLVESARLMRGRLAS
jgi:hypothetical protein